ncbi:MULTISPECIES: alpha/beta fold hydrolase [unclassified Modestobacter]|uniref:alpha/beta fold hydrolase n=1 Tax=unclassified Modestobacter TaxID=2643866 RepID=UPI0022AB357F|nr:MULTISPECIES: alpha/beta hydrolase [unclassified Modestobacter]MCZ2823662.1 alpha/beta hydrolase [Modestobacter sp. VKM Ac-2981]MCZ2851907.1 alpha/beta hydrolase [Modestobacter sp. VKM Ac-2982]
MAQHGHLRLGRTAGLVGAAVGLAAAGTAVGVAVTRTATARVRAGQLAGQRGENGRPVEDVPVNQLRREDPLGAGRRTADRTVVVRADDGVALTVEEVGPTDAPLTVVFVHGYALSMASWTFQRRDLGEQLATANGHRPTARLVFYDQRGHGASGRGAPERSTIDQLAADLESVLTARVPRGPVVLVGHSMGGMTVLALAQRRPELFGTRVAGVALVSTSSGNLGDLDFGLPALLTRVRATVLPVAVWAMRRRPGLAEVTRRLAKDVVSAVTWSMSFSSTGVDPALGRYVDAMIAGTPVDVVAEFYPAIAGLDVSGAIEPLCRVPTVVLTGDADKLIPKAHSERIRTRLEESGDGAVEYVAVPDAGHLVPLEHPGQVTDVLAGLIRRVAAGQRPAD